MKDEELKVSKAMMICSLLGNKVILKYGSIVAFSWVLVLSAAAADRASVMVPVAAEMVEASSVACVCE